MYSNEYKNLDAFLMRSSSFCCYRVSSGHKNITVTSESTTEDIIRTALKKFGIEVQNVYSALSLITTYLLDACCTVVQEKAVCLSVNE